MNALDAHLSDTERALLERAARSSREVLAPLAAAGEPGAVNRPLVAALASEGFLAGLSGTAHVTAVELCLTREGLARFSTDAETAFALQGLGADPIVIAGSTAARERWLPRVASGEAVVAFALTEPGAGSDVAALSLAAERDGDGYRLSGEKCFISNAPEADIYSVFARTTPGAGRRGITAFLVRGDSAGLAGTATPLLSPHPIGSLRFDGVRVERDDIIGEIDRGFDLAMRALDLFRPSVGAGALGMAQAALDAAVQHVTRRRAFGRTLGELQAVSHRLADAATSVQAARLLVHAAAVAYDAGADGVRQLAAMAKLFATEAAAAAIDAAVQVVGARALVGGSVLEHLYRDVRGMRIYEGASEVQREIIARHLLRGADGDSG